MDPNSYIQVCGRKQEKTKKLWWVVRVVCWENLLITDGRNYLLFARHNVWMRKDLTQCLSLLHSPTSVVVIASIVCPLKGKFCSSTGNADGSEPSRNVSACVYVCAWRERLNKTFPCDDSLPHTAPAVPDPSLDTVLYLIRRKTVILSQNTVFTQFFLQLFCRSLVGG